MGAGDGVGRLKEGYSILTLEEEQVPKTSGRAEETQVEARLRGARCQVCQFPKLVEKPTGTERQLDSGIFVLRCFS